MSSTTRYLPSSVAPTRERSGDLGCRVARTPARAPSLFTEGPRPSCAIERPVVGQTVLDETCNRPQWAQRIIDTRRSTVGHFSADCTQKPHAPPHGPAEPRQPDRASARVAPPTPSTPPGQPWKLWATLPLTWSQQVEAADALNTPPDSHQPALAPTHNRARNPPPRFHSDNRRSPQSPQPLRTPREINLILLSSQKGALRARAQTGASVQPTRPFVHRTYPRRNPAKTPSPRSPWKSSSRRRSSCAW
jgi:hypothetical protein